MFKWNEQRYVLHINIKSMLANSFSLCINLVQKDLHCTAISQNITLTLSIVDSMLIRPDEKKWTSRLEA